MRVCVCVVGVVVVVVVVVVLLLLVLLLVVCVRVCVCSYWEACFAVRRFTLGFTLVSALRPAGLRRALGTSPPQLVVGWLASARRCAHSEDPRWRSAGRHRVLVAIPLLPVAKVLP